MYGVPTLAQLVGAGATALTTAVVTDAWAAVRARLTARGDDREPGSGRAGDGAPERNGDGR